MTHETESLQSKRFSLVDGLCATWLSIQQTQSPEAFQGRGMVIPEGQVTVALSGQIQTEPFDDFHEAFETLRKEEMKAKDPLSILLKRLQCTTFEELAIYLALVPELNRKYERVFAYLQDNIKLNRATVGLCADLYGLVASLEDDELYRLSDRALPINRYVLDGEGNHLSRILSLREPVLLMLNGNTALPASLTSFCTMYRSAECPDPLIRQEECKQISRIVSQYQTDDFEQSCLIELCGAEGSGRKFLLEYASAACNIPALILDSRHLALESADSRLLLLDTIVSWAYLNHGFPVFTHFDFNEYAESDRQDLILSILQQIQGQISLLAICSEKILRLPVENFQVFMMELSACTLMEQHTLWDGFLGQSKLPPSPEISSLSLASIYTMTPGQIRQTLSAATADSCGRGMNCIDRSAITHGVQFLCRPRLSRLAEPLSSTFTWDDLILEKPEEDAIHDVCDRIRLRFQVNEEWGFNRKLPYGKGISVCLYGPPGTGKTMTAQILAHEFGLDAYRIDVSRIMDKYIGETEKKLAELFDAAKDCNAVLFFDEADALFAKRSEVNDSKDKYANAETAYLLQRMEQHNGVSILATNAVQNFDPAFKRRISFMINLSMPSPEIRKKLWHSVYPAGAPLHAGVDLDFFAEQFELSGSSIKNIAVASAFFASAKGHDITREDIGRAIRVEYRKNGRVFSEGDLFPSNT
ncbi:MAG: ATP-binding protein [Butyrivibrio sp.]|jgi:hypothetical protein|nr:ATP-binding protein [Butyrivibrio sp.]